jgi:hypothetical protein
MIEINSSLPRFHPKEKNRNKRNRMQPNQVPVGVGGWMGREVHQKKNDPPPYPGYSKQQRIE